jgi:glycosyltransferase involved in cell wall biosynthesis
MLGGWIAAGASALLSYNMVKNLKGRLRLASMSDLDQQGAQFDSVIEDLTLAIPVRNEAHNLKTLLPLLAKQRVRPKETVFLNDGSTDETSQLLHEYASGFGDVRIVNGQPLESNWRGKVFALSQLTTHCRTKKIVFMDADVRPRGVDAIASLNRGYIEACGNQGLLTVFPRPDDQAASRLLVDQIFLHLYYFLPYRGQAIGMGRGAVAGCGQVMFARVDDLRQLNAFESFKASTHDGLQLARSFDRAKMPVKWADGDQQFSVKMYQGFAEAFRGFSRNSFEASGSIPMVATISVLIFWVFVLPFVLWPLFLLSPGWLVAFLIVLASQSYLSAELGLGAQNVVLTPVKSMASVAVHLWGATRVQLRLGTRWKDRVIT